MIDPPLRCRKVTAPQYALRICRVFRVIGSISGSPARPIKREVLSPAGKLAEPVGFPRSWRRTSKLYGPMAGNIRGCAIRRRSSPVGACRGRSGRQQRGGGLRRALQPWASGSSLGQGSSKPSSRSVGSGGDAGVRGGARELRPRQSRIARATSGWSIAAAAVVAGSLYFGAAAVERWGPRPAVVLEDCFSPTAELPAGTEAWVRPTSDGRWLISGSDDVVCPPETVELVFPLP